jgi:hypothetical protein
MRCIEGTKGLVFDDRPSCAIERLPENMAFALFRSLLFHFSE